jgi:hypothetical protein
MTASGTTVTDSVDGSTGWTKEIESAANSAQIWTKKVSSAVSRTVTADDGGSGFNNYIAMKVDVFTGCHLTDWIGATGTSTSTTNDLTASAYTSTVDHSFGTGCALDTAINGVPTSSDTLSAGATGADHSHATVRKAAATSTASTAVTLNFNAAGAGTAGWHWVAIELLPGYSLDQEGFRWRDDDGNETGATWRQSQDTADTADLDEQVRLRVLIDASDDPSNLQYLLEHKQDTESSGLWRPIGIGAPGSTPTIVGFGSAALSTNDPSVNLSSGSWTPAENDIVVLFAASTTTLAAAADTADWLSVLGDGVEVNSDAHGYAAFYHVVTSGEAGGSTTFTATNMLAAAETGNCIGVAVRGADPDNPIHVAAAAFNSGNTTTPDVLAALTGATQPTITGCLVVRGICQDSTGSYSDPASHTSVTSNNTNQIHQVWTRDAATTAGADVDATNVTPDAGDEDCAITIAFLAAPGTPAVIYATSSQYADGAATTAQLTAPSGKSTSNFTDGVMVEAQALADAVDIVADEYTEIEWCLKAQTPAVDTDVFEFRVTANGTPFATYTVTPELTVATGSGTNAAAGNAAATGSASTASTKVAPSAGHASATGAAGAITAKVSPSAGHAAATGAASGATTKVSPSAGHASATGAAFDATVSTGGAATNAAAGHAAATGAASNVQASVAASAGLASGTGAASTASTKVAPSVGIASGTGTAHQATALTGSFTNAAAGLASGTGAASTASTKVSPVISAASGTGAANTPNASVAPHAGHAAGTGAASSAQVSIAVSAVAAFATAVALAITAKVSPTAGHASATGQAFDGTTSDVVVPPNPDLTWYVKAERRTFTVTPDEEQPLRTYTRTFLVEAQ